MGRVVLFMFVTFLAASGCAMDDATTEATEESFVELHDTVLDVEAPRICLPRADEARKPVEIRIFAMPMDDVPVEAVLEGCNVWSVVGVSCVLVDDPDKANITLRQEAFGVPNGAAGGLTEGLETPTRLSVTFYPRWWWSRQRPEPSTWERERRAFIIGAHEIGHALGMAHIPSGTDDTREVIHPVYGPLEGSALMNSRGRSAYIAPMTFLDILFYEIRDVERSNDWLGVERAPCTPID